MMSSASCLWKTFQEVVRTAHESLTLSPGRRSESARIAAQIDLEIECSLDPIRFADNPTWRGTETPRNVYPMLLYWSRSNRARCGCL